MSKKLTNKDSLSIQQLIMPFISHNDFNRIQMACSQLNQAIPLVNMETPRCQSIYNREMVKHSNMILKAETNAKNLGIVKLFDEKFIMIEDENKVEIYKIDNPMLGSAFTAYNTYITDKKELKKGEPILINGNSDIDGNLQIGVNALVGYIVYGQNFEDAAIISESFAKKLTHIEKYVVEFIVNRNEYLLNLYGDDKEYKCLPDVGSYVNPNSRILCAKRIVKNGWKSFMNLFDESNRKINFFGDDEIYYGSGKVVDVSVFSNMELSENEIQKTFHKSIKEVIDINDKNIKEFLEKVKPYLSRYKDKEDSFTFGPNLQYYYNKFRKIDNDNILVLNDKKFDGYLVRITIEKEVIAEVGDKFANMHGGKSVFTLVLPDDEMPKREKDGKPLDLIISPNSVIGRINIGQIHETTLNKIGESVYNDIVNQKDIKKAFDIYLEFMKDLLPERLYDQLDVLEKMNEEEKETFISSIKEDGFIKIPQVPFETIEFEDFKKWYNKYNLTDDFITINGKKIKKPILTGHQYIMKLKHVPFKKLSACNYTKCGTKTLQPKKDNAKLKSHKTPISSSPNTIGEQEFSILMSLSNDINVLRELVFLKSSDVKNREKFLHKLYENKDISLNDFENLHSISIHNLSEYLKVIGVKLN